VQRLTRAAQPHRSVDAPVPPDAEPWRFVAAQRPISEEDALAAVRQLRSLDRGHIAAALGRLREGRPHFAGGEAFALPLFRNGADPLYKRTRELWLLADDRIVTDRLECAREALPGGAHRWRWDFETISGIGTLDRRAGGYKRLPKDPMFAVRRDLAGKSFEPPRLPGRCYRHLLAIGEASFAWRGAVLPLTEPASDAALPVELAPPLESRTKIHFGGGRHVWSWLTTRLSLDGPAEAGEPLAYGFQDRTGLAGAGPIGRFTFDAETPALRDPARGEALVLEASSGIGDGGPGMLRFRWSAPGASYPFVMRRELDTHGRPVLAIDQQASAALRGQETGADGPPPQRSWRAALEGCVDALLCWPDHPRTGRSGPVLSHGGWIAGSWSGDIARRFEIRQRSFGEAAPEATAEPEQSWQLLAGEWPREDTGLTPAGLRDGWAGDLRQLLADRPTLHGIVREDKAALLVHSRTEQRPMREDAMIYTQVWLYADADVALEIRQERPWGLHLDSVGAPAALRAGGETLWREESCRQVPTPLLWRRLVLAIEAHAWLRGAEERYPVKISGGPLAGGAAGLEIRLWRQKASPGAEG
jgi:hypothetical protein